MVVKLCVAMGWISFVPSVVAVAISASVPAIKVSTTATTTLTDAIWTAACATTGVV